MALAIEFPQVVWSIEFGGDETVVRQVTMTGGGGAGGGGVTVHNDLTGRSDADTHPISSITGLSAALAAAGNVDSVNGETGAVVLDAADVGALASGSGYNTANGWLKLDGSGTAPDSTIPASIARDSEVTSAVSAHAGATDPHGDRAYAAGLVDDLSGVTNAATARSNLGLGTAATQASTAFDAAGAASAAQAASQPVDSDLTAIAGLSPANDDFVQRKAGAWTNRTVAQVKADLGVPGFGPVPTAKVGVDNVWLGPPLTTSSASTLSSVLSGGGGVATSRTYLLPGPIWVPTDCYVDAIAIHQGVAATDSGATIELAYTGVQSYPLTGTLEFSAGTTDATATAGVRMITFTPRAISAGLHWGLMKFNTATTAGTNPQFTFLPTVPNAFTGVAPASSYTPGRVQGHSLGGTAAIPSNLDTVSPVWFNNNSLWIGLRVYVP